MLAGILANGAARRQSPALLDQISMRSLLNTRATFFVVNGTTWLMGST